MRTFGRQQGQACGQSLYVMKSVSFNCTFRFDSQSCNENNLIVPLGPLGAMLEIILLEATVAEHSFTDS